MKRVLPAVLCATGLMISGCQPEPTETEQANLEDVLELGPRVLLPEIVIGEPVIRPGVDAIPDFFDCVRENQGLVIASHRAGPAPGYPENALETLQYATRQGIYVHEIDVAESRDGVLFLMHDRTLGRTTTGNGYVADTDWQDIRALNLVDNDGEVTKFTPPKLSDVLLWAKQSGVIVELDKKPTTSFRNIISHVRAAGADDNVILITYNDAQAIEVADLAPTLMMTAGVNSRDHQYDLEAAGVNFENVIAWMGISNPNPRAFAAVGRRGVEAAFGTLGRPGERLDDLYWQDGDGREYQDLVDGGLTLLATDTPYRVAEALDADERALKACALR